MPVCVVCSGSDFVCESGFYYCSECQTQSQDVREEINDNDDAEEEEQVLGGKRRRSAKSSDGSSTSEENMTTWEAFNFALLGLVNEVIALGVKPSFKTVMLKLWSAYLRKMEVAFFTKDGHALPKLGPNFKKTDANLIYGYTSEKETKKEKSSKNEEIEDDPSGEGPHDPEIEVLKRRKSLKRNRTAFRQNYEKMMHEMSLTSQTLTDVTLEMLAVSEIENEGPKELQFNADGLKEQNFKGNVNCHPGLLVRNKLIILLYLGLLVSGEKVNLSDLLRWISEGHISYSNLWKFFPSEKYVLGELSQLFIVYQPCPPYHNILLGTGRVAAYLGLKTLELPSFKDLIKHYIKELNLPAQLSLVAERLYDLVPSHSKFVPSQTKFMPNREGRAMSLIIIALKLLFGLDDATEHRNSRIAQRINKELVSQNESLRLFVWDDWERFCVLRRTALTLFHEPSFLKTKMSTSMIQNINPFISQWNKAFPLQKASKRHAILDDTYRGFLRRLLDKDISDGDCVNKLSFRACLSPYSSYIEVISRAYKRGIFKGDSSEWNHVVGALNLDLLNENFKDTSIDYLTHPNEYIEWAQQQGLRIGLHNGSAVASVYTTESKHLEINYKPDIYRVKVYLGNIDGMPLSEPSSDVPSTSAPNVTPVIRTYINHRPLIFPNVDDQKEKNPLPLIGDMNTHAREFQEIPAKPKPRKSVGRKGPPKRSYDSLPKEDEDHMLHMPHTEYWTCSFSLSQDKVPPKEVWKLPQSFQWLLDECASLIEMHPATLLKEIINLETLHKDLLDHLSGEDKKFGYHALLSSQNRKDKW